MNHPRSPFPLLAIPYIALAMQMAGGQTSNAPDGYVVETIPLPPGEQIGVGGLAFQPDGSLLISSREGQVWRYHEGDFSLFADGLHEALGLHVDQDTGAVWVMQRPELTKLVDEDADGRADLYQTVNATWGLTDNYHEYAFGPVRDSSGAFYGALNTSLSWRGWAGSFQWDVSRVHDSRMGRARRFGGWIFQITPDGQFVPFASGVRSPAGLGINRHDELFYTDNQGDWNGSSTLQHVVKGRFHGHPSSLMDDPEYREKDLSDLPVSYYEQLRHPPAVFFVHGDLANSPGEPTFNETGGRFGSWYEDQVFVGDQSKSVLMRVDLEKINGEYQGSVYPFVQPMQSGIVRNVFDKSGRLWVGQTGRGWRSIGDELFGLQTVRWDGVTVPYEIRWIRLAKEGFQMRFTSPLDPAKLLNPQDFKVHSWRYLYRPEYGSPKEEYREEAIESLRLSEDGYTATMDLSLQTGRVYQFKVGAESKDGRTLVNDVGWYTLNWLPEIR